jgi:hypothetical protein
MVNFSKSATWSQQLNQTIHRERVYYDSDCPDNERLNVHPNYKVPDILDNTLYELTGCTGRFCLYFENESSHHDRYKISTDSIHIVAGKRNLRLNSLAAMVAYCVHDKWRNVKLVWQSDRIADDVSWPGGYDQPSIYRSNARVIRKEYGDTDVFVEDDGIWFDVRFIGEDLLETLTGLENYCLIDEDGHSNLEMELQDEAWDNWAKDDWRWEVINKIKGCVADTGLDIVWDEDSLDDKEEELLELFRVCCESQNENWFEDGTDQYIRIDKVAKGLTLEDVYDLTGLNLLPASQVWRYEPYPWADGSNEPLEVVNRN